MKNSDNLNIFRPEIHLDFIQHSESKDVNEVSL